MVMVAILHFSPCSVLLLLKQSRTNFSAGIYTNRTTSAMMMMVNSSSPISSSSSSSSSSAAEAAYPVPGLEAEEVDRIADQTMKRYSLSSRNSRRNAGAEGTAIVWFRNDLRVLDNEALYQAWASSQAVLPVYCLDPRIFQSTTYHFGFPKTGALRAQFLIECLVDLRNNLMKRGLNLLIRHGKPEEILPSLAKAFAAHTIYAQKETCSEEVNVERLVSKALCRVQLSASNEKSTKLGSTDSPRLQLIWGGTMYHIDDLPFSANSTPDVYTQFRKSVEAKCSVRGCIKLPESLAPAPDVEDWGQFPTTDQFGLQLQKITKGMRFWGGESAALSRVHEYFWKKDLVKVYKETRNGMLGPDYSTKFSPWLASGSLSPRVIYEEVKKYEKERVANDSTYWVLFEMIWRDYFRFLSIKYGNSIFRLGGPRELEHRWSQDQRLFESWRDGCTGLKQQLLLSFWNFIGMSTIDFPRLGDIVFLTMCVHFVLENKNKPWYPLIDANMKELFATGFMSNRGRQIVCSFLVRDMGIDWRMGAEWFETCLLDYDPCSNYGNWTYGAGVGTDPREDRYFSIPKQAQTYDPEGKYVAYWLPQLKRLPREKRNFPGTSYIPQIVPLKFGNPSKQQPRVRDHAANPTNYGGIQRTAGRGRK